MCFPPVCGDIQVEHVLLYDFPRDPIEYMRRVGRTARAGRKGVVTVLAWGRQVSEFSQGCCETWKLGAAAAVAGLVTIVDRTAPFCAVLMVFLRTGFTPPLWINKI